MTFNEFRNSIQKVHSPKKGKLNCTYNIRKIVHYIKEHKMLPFVVDRALFGRIISDCNKEAIKELIDKKVFKLPSALGRLELIKTHKYIKIKDDKVVTNNVIDWPNTIKLWYEDKGAYNNRTLVRLNRKVLFIPIYNKSPSRYKNNKYFGIEFKRSLKQQICTQDNDFEAYSYDKRI